MGLTCMEIKSEIWVSFSRFIENVSVFLQQDVQQWSKLSNYMRDKT